MSLLFTILADDCAHPQWCRAKRDGEHSPECPTRLCMSDGDVDAFCAQHVSVDAKRLPGVRHVVRILDGKLDNGLTASASVSVSVTHDGGVSYCTYVDEREVRRWLAEHLVKHQRLGTRP